MYGTHHCGGSLLRLSDSLDQSDVVITALHCLFRPRRKRMLKTRDLSIVAGQHSLRDIEDGETRHEVDAFDFLPYATELSQGGKGLRVADIAVIKLKTYTEAEETLGDSEGGIDKLGKT